MYYIYYYKNKINGKMYVGQTEDLKKRHNHHKYSNALLIDKAIKKYGIDNFIFKTIEMCLTQEEANEREIFWIDFFHSHVSLKMGYNRSWGGNSCLDDDTRKKIGDKVRGPLNYNYGKSVRNDIRKKMSESMSGVKNPKAKLNLEIVNQIRSSNLTKPQLASKFNVDLSTISRIINNKTWKNK